VGKNSVLSAHVQKPIYYCDGRRAGWERTVFFPHTYRSQYIVLIVEGRGGKEQGSFRTRTGAIQLRSDGRAGWERTVYFPHTFRSQYFTEVVEERGGKEQGSFRTRTGSNECVL
jgi:hypothetical protein